MHGKGLIPSGIGGAGTRDAFVMHPSSGFPPGIITRCYARLATQEAVMIATAMSTTIRRATARARAMLHGCLLAAAVAVSAVHAAPFQLKVMTQNLYFGTDLTPVLTAPNQSALIGAVTTAYGQVVASDPA